MIELNLDNFKEAVIRQKGIVIIDAYASFCPGCLSFGQKLLQLMQKYPSVTWTRLNTSEQKEITSAFNIQSVPYILLFKDGHFKNGCYVTDILSLDNEIQKLLRG